MSEMSDAQRRRQAKVRQLQRKHNGMLARSKHVTFADHIAALETTLAELKFIQAYNEEHGS